ncbi:MAG: Alanyl-tRNA editing protein AlaX-M [Candidatus Bathyarchaeota archaeon B26-2]|nr:MAG: Alanyl-tRNA editing protein AlaX-M [Candidatus Bathyarchaeota archaeon B26-2]
MKTKVVKALYLEDSYLKECDAHVVSVKDERYVILDQTIFYPGGGGQPCDTGIIKKGDEVYRVVHVKRSQGEVLHEVDGSGLKPGDKVHCIIDWDRRYRLMRSHTAAHVFASLLCRETGALITGNQLGLERIRFDFNLKEFNREILRRYIEKTNDILKRDIPVRWYEVPREEALKIPGVIRMAKALPPKLPRLRLVEIVGIDIEADGGTHVRNLREVGQLRMLKAENKGKNNRRVYFSLIP